MLDKILADEFKMIGSDGEYSTKKEQLQYIKTHKPSYISFKFEMKRLEIFENGTAIVSGTGTIRKKMTKANMISSTSPQMSSLSETMNGRRFHRTLRGIRL